MKTRILALLIISVLSVCAVSAQTSSNQTNPAGKWKFEAPYAPEGYTSGTIEISFAENKYSTTISFTGSDFKIPCDKIKVEKENVSFVVLVEGNEVTVSLISENDLKMSGKAVYSEGEIPLTLTRDIPKD